MQDRIGVCCSGGGAKGAFQAGALNCLNDNAINVHAYSGASVGALNAAMAAQGSFDVLADMWKHIHAREIYAGRINFPGLRWIPRFWPGTAALYTTRPLERLIEKNISTQRLKNNEPRLYVQTCQVSLGVFVDGGWCNNTPIRPLTKFAACNKIIVLSLTPEDTEIDWRIGGTVSGDDGAFAKFLRSSASVPVIFDPVTFAGVKAPTREALVRKLIEAALEKSEQTSIDEMHTINQLVKSKQAVNGSRYCEALICAPKTKADLHVKHMLDFSAHRCTLSYSAGYRRMEDCLTEWKTKGLIE